MSSPDWYPCHTEPVSLTGEAMAEVERATARLGENHRYDFVSAAEIGVQTCRYEAQKNHVVGAPPKIPSLADETRYAIRSIGYKTTQFLDASERRGHEAEVQQRFEQPPVIAEVTA